MKKKENKPGQSDSDGFRLIRPGLTAWVSLPRYGQQDLGHSPGGAMDCFSLRRGNLMLGNPPAAPALEMIVPPEIEITAPGCFVLTGAKRPAQLRREAAGHELEHSHVYQAQPGDRILFGKKQYGLRTYFCYHSGREKERPFAGGTVLPFSGMAGWMDPQGRIRVLPGPEYSCLENPQLFFSGTWKTTAQMDKMGMRLAGSPRLVCTLANMISEAVADGTVQLTPDGPIILLRHRQTTGGYPRIFNVISVDIDLLGQYGPNERVRFMPVNREEACALARQKESVLERCRP